MSKPPKKSVEMSVSVHKAVPGCCRSALIAFAARDCYQGAGEPGDEIRCGCGNTLVYGYRGWRLKAAPADPQETAQ